MSEFYIGLDLGQASDYTAICVLERFQIEGHGVFHLRHLERPRLGTTYLVVIARVRELMDTPALRLATLIVDATGVGAPVVDLLRDAGLGPVAVTITGGNTVTSEGSSYSVPKRDLVSALTVLFQSGRLKVAEDLAEARTLVNELLAFKVKINVRTAHDSYEAWREGVHDDLVLSVALAVWYGEKGSALPMQWLKLPPSYS